MLNIVRIGVAQQTDLPDCGSLDVSCSFQLDLDEALVLPDSDGFLATVKQACVACHQAVTNELQQHQVRTSG